MITNIVVSNTQGDSLLEIDNSDEKLKLEGKFKSRYYYLKAIDGDQTTVYRFPSDVVVEQKSVKS